MRAFASLRSAFNAVTDTGRVPNEIRICLELVQTCHQDLQDLISLRNKHLELLEAAPAQILTRLNTVIDQANRGLAAARAIVEKCRPQAHHGNKTPLHSQLEWAWGASSEFRCQEPLLSRHHAAVLAELNFLRQLTTWAVLGDSTARMSPMAALLSSDHETSTKVSARISSVPRAWTPSSSQGTPTMTYANMIEYPDFPEPVFPDALAETASSADTASLASARRSPTWGTTGRERAASRSAVHCPM
ncbi:hypothetical protein LMH87_002439 [Akanthomyces muscarius]|uniref:Uncharacterized protein n=1 Tax=Akanthomyces muscarius TaxID=2231603 RepID=A0A9W8Q6A5_AKAMU|nr:hypothetical protein LMH87_002439 [Akanthomyces muscarius]KAJ4147947.1 hypothetical protein LMH87_002439 [Akanthomyces muscarius]